MKSRVLPIELRELIPRVPQSAFYGSSGIHFVVMVVFGTVNPLNPQQSPWAVPHWLNVCSYYVDPLVLNLISLLAAAVIFLAYIFHRERLPQIVRGRPVTCICTIVLLGISLVILWAIEQWFLKPAFHYVRPAHYDTESIIVGLFRPPVHLGAGSCPSGFVLRQIWLLQFAWVFATAATRHTRRSYYGGIHGDRRVQTAFFVLATCTVLVACSRIGIGAHSIFDIAMSVGTGSYLFWLAFLPLASLFAKTESYMYTDIVAMSCVHLPLFFFYSQDASYWTIASIVIFCALGIVHHFSPLKTLWLTEDENDVE